MIGRRLDSWSWIHNFHICWTRVRTKLTDVRTVVLELRFLPYVLVRPNGNPRRLDGCINLPLFELGKNIWADWSLDVVRTDASWNRSFSIKWRVRTEIHVVRTNDTRFVGCSDGMARRPNGWQGTNFSDLQNLLKHFCISKTLLNNIFTYKWFLSK
jgi:hypothetical protein